MDSPSGQVTSGVARAGSAPTRRRLLRAAAQLIAEVGWGRVTTRAIAARAGLPHGTVSYHFRGKQALLTEAAVHTVEQMFPPAQLEAVRSVDDLVNLATSWMADPESTDPVGPAVLLEAMRESTRDAVLRERIASALRAYRKLVAGLVRAEQRSTPGRPSPVLTPSAVATLFVAAGDGLWLHALLDPRLDIAGAAEAMRVLLHQRTGGGSR
jgi:AcrR family transcriptional regulator